MLLVNGLENKLESGRGQVGVGGCNSNSHSHNSFVGGVLNLLLLLSCPVCIL